MKPIKEGRRKYWPLDHKKHGIGGLLLKKPLRKKQDRRANPSEMFAVVFFPKITGIGHASVDFFGVHDTMSKTASTATARFMDRLHHSCTWEEYHRAGHRVRRIKITDLGDA